MTEQPTTAAGRRLHETYHGDQCDPDDCVLIEHIDAIEAEARQPSDDDMTDREAAEYGVLDHQSLPPSALVSRGARSMTEPTTAAGWKRKYEGMVKERDDQIVRKREGRRILKARQQDTSALRLLRDLLSVIEFEHPNGRAWTQPQVLDRDKFRQTLLALRALLRGARRMSGYHSHPGDCINSLGELLAKADTGSLVFQEAWSALGVVVSALYRRRVATSPAPPLQQTLAVEPVADTTDPHEMAVELGRRGGRKGGLARARSLSPERRSEIAQGAARARWQTTHASTLPFTPKADA